MKSKVTPQFFNTCYSTACKLRWMAATFLISLLQTYAAFAQDRTGVDYLFILENKNDLNLLNKRSLVNPNNYQDIKSASSTLQFYPILKVEKSITDSLKGSLNMEGNFKSFSLSSDSLTFGFQELYGQLSLKDKHFFQFGKKRLNWGSGLIWNPTIFYTQKEPLRFVNRLEGIMMLNYSYVKESSSLSFYLFPKNSVNSSGAAIKYDFSVKNVDASLSVLKNGKHTELGYNLSYAGNFFTLYSEGALRDYTKSFSISDSGQLLNPNEIKKNKFVELIVGSSVIFSPRTTLFLEARYKGDNLNSGQINVYRNNLPGNEVLYDPIGISKYNIFGSIEYRDLYGRWSLNLRNYFDPLSRQLILSPLCAITKDSFQVELSSTFFTGNLSVFKSQSTILFRLNF